MGRASHLDAEGLPGAEAGPCLDSSFSWETLAVLKPLSPYSPSPNFPEVSSHSEESHPHTFRCLSFHLHGVCPAWLHETLPSLGAPRGPGLIHFLGR